MTLEGKFPRGPLQAPAQPPRAPAGDPSSADRNSPESQRARDSQTECLAPSTDVTARDTVGGYNVAHDPTKHTSAHARLHRLEGPAAQAPEAHRGPGSRHPEDGRG